MVLELRLLHLAGNRMSTDTLGGILSIGNFKAHYHRGTLLPPRPYLLHQATPPNSATPYEILGANYIQSTTVCVHAMYLCIHMYTYMFVGAFRCTHTCDGQRMLAGVFLNHSAAHLEVLSSAAIRTCYSG